MARRNNSATRDGEDDKAKSLQCFLNQPNINMVVPWIYEIYKSMASSSSRDGSDDIEKGLECFSNQPNINMTIPWIYQIYKSVKSGEGGGAGSDLEWTDETGREEG